MAQNMNIKHATVNLIAVIIAMVIVKFKFQNHAAVQNMNIKYAPVNFIVKFKIRNQATAQNTNGTFYIATVGLFALLFVTKNQNIRKK